MKVLFIRSGNSGTDPISTNQGESLLRKDVEIVYFDVIGKGTFGYVSNIFKIRKFVKNQEPDIIHAHYSLSGIVATLTFCRIPIGVSLMGSDVHNPSNLVRIMLRLFSKYFWSFTIVKSFEMYQRLGVANAIVLPNGVNCNSFYPIFSDICKEKVGWEKSKKHIFFPSSPDRPEKNFKLAKQAFDLLQFEMNNVELHVAKSINHADMVYYYNAADVMVFTSIHEGSPNAVKEAMACNCPIVSTDVGDVKSVLGDAQNSYISSYSPYEFKEIMLTVLKKGTRTDGRKKIEYLKSELIAEKLIGIYKSILSHD